MGWNKHDPLIVDLVLKYRTIAHIHIQGASVHIHIQGASKRAHTYTQGQDHTHRVKRAHTYTGASAHIHIQGASERAHTHIHRGKKPRAKQRQKQNQKHRQKTKPK